jgi:predicted AAA+ superfamily ATPase
MYRKALYDLMDWKDRPSRKPLIIRGARQVGKTWLVRKFSDQFDNLVEINFDKNPEKAQLFAGRDINRCLQLLQIDCDTEIIPGKTLLFLDEIQAAPELLPLLRYFYEELADLHVIAAGSLLEFLLADHDFSMPVGRVEYLHLGPMDIEEFLLALGQERMTKFLKDHALNDTIPDSVHLSLLNFLKLFWIVGGMPAAVAWYSNSGQLPEAISEHAAILQTYEDDFSKYRKRIYPERLRKVFRRIPALIGNKLKYVRLDPDERSRELSETLHLLEMAQVIYRVRHSAGNGVPLGAEAKDRDFKPLFLDTGLVSTSLGLSLPSLEMVDDLLMVNNGALAEQFVGQHLLYDGPGYLKPQLFYWNREQKSASAEVDYLIAQGDAVVPIEVKAGTTGTLKSLQVFVAEKKSSVALRFNAMPPSCSWQETRVAGKDKVPFLLVSLPLYLIGQTRRLIADGIREKT